MDIIFSHETALQICGQLKIHGNDKALSQRSSRDYRATYAACSDETYEEKLQFLKKEYGIVSVLKALLFRNDVTEVINACDAGREGELIFRFVMEKAGCKKPVKRLWISSMEESAIRKGFGFPQWKKVLSEKALKT